MLDLKWPGSDARRRISGEIADVVAQGGAGAIVPGCAGMVDLAASLAVEHGLPVIDRVAAACGFAETLVRMRAVPDAA